MPESSAGELYQITIVQFGTRSTHKSDVYLNYSMYGHADEPVDMGYFFWVIRNAERTVVVDTGFSVVGGERRRRVQTLDLELAFTALGLDAEVAPTVVVSHAHYDHIGNLRAFPRSEVVVAESEIVFWSSAIAQRGQFARSVEADEIEYLVGLSGEGRLRTYSDSLTLFPGIELIEVGGHTAGQTVVVVQTADGRVVLASDAVHFHEEYEADRPYAFVSDVPRTYSAYDRIRELVGSAGILVSGHDISTLGRFAPVVDGPLTGFTATIG